MKHFSFFCPNPSAAAKLLQSCLTLCDPIDGSPPGSPIPGILQARTLEWGAITFYGPNARKPKDKWKGAQIEEVRVKTQHNREDSNA